VNGDSVRRIPYRVQTPRLDIRCWSPEDTAALREALDESADHLRPWIPFMKDEPRTFDQTCQWLREARASFDRDLAWHYAVFDRRDGRLLGGNMLNPRVGDGGLELGYWTRSDAVRKGYALEASAAMVRCAFEIHGVERAEIHCAPENLASAAVPARLGFSHEATLKNRVKDTEGNVMDLMIWTLLKEEYSDHVSSPLSCSARDASGRQIDWSPGIGD
jgi:RimJ/RimL family protein N-acetyltransferase